jgi:AbrB family looped-hinge helix DNA binding protein
MGYRVGNKGQVVIQKDIRDTLGIQPGWIAIQLLVDDHVEIRFYPPEHNESLLGILAPYTSVSFPDEDSLREARERAREEAALERWRRTEQTADA